MANSIPVTEDRHDVRERCCFCRAETYFWATSNDVACCETCAKNHTPAELPSKKTWVDREVWLHLKKRHFDNHFDDYKFANGLTYNEMIKQGLTIDIPTPETPKEPSQ